MLLLRSSLVTVIPLRLASNLREFQALVNQWPPDSCDRKHTIRGLLEERIKLNSSSDPNESLWFSEQERQSLSRILNNCNRDKYKLPDGLGLSSLDSQAPKIGASGADLIECRRILANQEEYLVNYVPFWRRVFSSLKISLFPKSDSVKTF